MANDEVVPVEVSRRIAAPADAIFAVLADPGRHPEIDGSGMLREGADNSVIAGVGDVFEMNMYFDHLGGDYKMINHVILFEPGRRIGWDPAPGDLASSGNGEIPIGTPSGQRWSFVLAPDGPDATVVTEVYECANAPADLRAVLDNGRTWIEAMTKTLERLDEVCTGS